MGDDEVNTMPAGDGMNAAIGTALGWAERMAGLPVPDFSANLRAAWTLFEFFPRIVIQRATGRDGTTYRCSLPEPNDPGRAGQPAAALNGDGETAPLAICRCFLKAAGRGLENYGVVIK